MGKLIVLLFTLASLTYYKVEANSNLPNSNLPSSQIFCGRNSRYVFCDDYCKEYCDNTFTCVSCFTGCRCNEGYVHDKFSDVCVPRSSCDSGSCQSRNETYYPYGTAVDTCDGIVLQKATPGCYCRNGYAFNRVLKRCVARRDCPRFGRPGFCPRNENAERCKNPCEPTCSGQNYYYCPNFGVSDYPCSEGCECRNGFVRDDYNSGDCIREDQCLYYPNNNNFNNNNNNGFLPDWAQGLPL